MRKSVIIFLSLLPLVLKSATQTLPPENELKRLLSDSLLAFNAAVQQKDFTQFHQERLASAFQKQFPLEKFTEAFQVFIDKGYNIANIAQSEPLFDGAPTIDNNGLLILQGRYPIKPNELSFKLSYIYESSNWKITGINVRTNPVPKNSEPVPPKKELQKLASTSVLLLGDAIQSQHFDAFYNEIAKVWQKETTPQKLGEIFQTFVDQKSDLPSVANLEPSFDEPPAINDDGYLILKGSYPTRQRKLSFDLSYVSEGGRWKLVLINLHLAPHEEKPVEKAGEKPAKKKKKKKKEPSNDGEDESVTKAFSAPRSDRRPDLFHPRSSVA